jgi:hypothetical protein
VRSGSNSLGNTQGLTAGFPSLGLLPEAWVLLAYRLMTLTVVSAVLDLAVRK